MASGQGAQPAPTLVAKESTGYDEIARLVNLIHYR
jgi:hypothetical protein